MKLALRSANGTLLITALGLALAAMSGCGKVSEKATEKAAEKMIEGAMERDGVKNAKVDLSDGSVKATMTDKDGKPVTFEIGKAKLTEADVGLPFYPGATVDETKSNKMSSPDGEFASVSFSTADKADKVAAYYRDQMKPKGAGNQFMEMSGGDGKFTFMLNDEKTQNGTQVHIEGGGDATNVTIIASRKKAG